EPDARDHTTSGTSAEFLIHAIDRKETDLEEWFVVVNQIINPFACRQLTPPVLLFNLFFSAAKFCFLLSFAELEEKLLHRVFILVEFKLCFCHVGKNKDTGRGGACLFAALPHLLLVLFLFASLLQFFLDLLATLAKRGHRMPWVFIKVGSERVQALQQIVEIIVQRIFRHQLARGIVTT